MSYRCAFKVGIVGCGKVGMSTAFALLLKGIPTDLVLIARDEKKAAGEALDLEHALPFLETATIESGSDYERLAGCNVVLFTAGAAQAPGQTRLDLARENLKIIEQTIPKIMKHAPNAVVIIVTNPVDLLTYRANQVAKNARPGQIFGSGTLLDTARFRFHLAEFMNVNSRSIHTYILGEHGDSSFPALHSATVGGQTLVDMDGFSVEKAEAAFEAARTAAYKVIQGKGATFYAIAAVLTHIVRAIQRDSRSVMPVSVPLTDYYGVSEVALSVPCVVGNRGVEKILSVDLNATEQTALHHSAKTLKDAFAAAK